MTDHHDDMPRLRQVEPINLVLDGRQLIGLKDPLRLTETIMCVAPEAIPLLALMDGKHTLRDIQADLSRRAGRIVFLEEISAVVESLDDALLLDGERFREAFRRKVEAYRKSPFRPASHAGASYSADPDELREELSGFFCQDGGPGLPELFSDERRPVGLIAPHIDIRAGGRCFAHGYHALAVGQPSDVYVILGTGHSGVEGMFTATNLDFQTPLGTVETDRELLDLLGKRWERDPAAEEILHETEHVIEFQVIFLQFLFSAARRFKIVPILCSLSHDMFSDDDAHADQRRLFEGFCHALKETCRTIDRSVCFIASADLDHIGPRYGDSFVPHRGTVADALEKDESLLRALERVDVREFIRGVTRDNNARRICGFSPITTMLHCMDPAAGRLLSLDYAGVDDRSSFVSFTSMIFH